ncbi:MAG: hypothetical protein AB7Q17_09405 [Phycisphaerae bacterium]
MRTRLAAGLAAACLTGVAHARPECAGAWLPVPAAFQTTPFSGGVHALVSHNFDSLGPGLPTVFAGGQFSTVGGLSIPYVARWDGTSWHALGTGVDNIVRALTMFDPDGDGPAAAQLIAGGDFTHAGGRDVGFVAAWDGVAWSDLGGGFDAPVQALCVLDLDGPGPQPAALYAGGSFRQSAASPTRAIARWDGTAWQEVGGGLSGGGGIFDATACNVLAAHDPDGVGPAPEQLVVGGTFANAGGVTAGSIATWDGQQWTALGSGVFVEEPYAAVYAAASSGDPVLPRLVIGGFFTHAGGVEALGVASWDGASWSALPGLMLPVTAVAYLDDDASAFTPALLFAGGPTEATGGADGIARHRHGAWEPLASGVNGSVYSLRAHDPDGAGPAGIELLVGGIFTQAGGLPVNNLARWGCDRPTLREIRFFGARPRP